MKKIYISVIFILFQLNLNASDLINSPKIEPLFTLENISQKTELTPEELIISSIEFSEIDSQSFQAKEILEKYSQLEKIVTSSEFTKLNETDRAKQILSLMYEKTLTTYIESQSRITTMFQKGTYNCVSSSILYLSLAKAAGLKVIPQKTPSHAFCSVYINEEKIDVETTNPYGFNPGTKHELQAQNNKKAYAIIPQIKYQNRIEISEKNLISLIGANLYGIYLDKNIFEPAIQLALARINFLKTENTKIKEEARSDLDTIFSNYSIFLENKNNYFHSLNFLKDCVNKIEITEKLKETYNISLYNATVHELNNRNITHAKELFDSHKENISYDFQIKISEMIYIEELQSKLENATITEALQILDNTEKEITLTQNQNNLRINNLKEFFWIESINQDAAKENYIQAAKMADDYLLKMPNSQNLKQLKKTCLKNHEIYIHNKIVPLVNQKKYSQAMKILQEGLKENPTSIEIQNDINRLKKVSY